MEEVSLTVQNARLKQQVAELREEVKTLRDLLRRERGGKGSSLSQEGLEEVKRTTNLTDEGRARGRVKTGQIARSKSQEFYRELMPVLVMLRADGLSFQAVADRLNSGGVSTQEGGSFHAQTVSRILKLQD